MKHNPELPLHMYFCFIIGHPYFTIITGKANYRKTRRCRGQGRKDILKRLQAIVSRHNKIGFQVNYYHADNKFKNIGSDLVPYTLHTQAAGEHEPTSERKIRTRKDRTWSTLHSVPYWKMPLMTIDSL